MRGIDKVPFRPKASLEILPGYKISPIGDERCQNLERLARQFESRSFFPNFPRPEIDFVPSESNALK